MEHRLMTSEGREMQERDRHGRWTSGAGMEPRRIMMQVRMTRWEWECVKAHARQHGVCISVYVRRKLLDLMRL